jgi:serine/threonine-protein kinase RsbW
MDSGLQLTLPDTRDAVEICRLAFKRYLEPLGPSEQALFRVELVQEECLMNIIWHAFETDEEHSVQANVHVEGNDIVLRFEDSGRPFDPTQAADPKLPTSLADAAPGGLGLMLVRKFASDIAYQRVDERNRLTVTLPLR